MRVVPVFIYDRLCRFAQDRLELIGVLATFMAMAQVPPLDPSEMIAAESRVWSDNDELATGMSFRLA